MWGGFSCHRERAIASMGADMPDPRFFEDLGPVTLQDLAELTGAALADPRTGTVMITLAAPLGRAVEGAVGFLSDRRYLDELATTRASACFLRADQAALAPARCAALVTPEPQAAWARAAGRLHRPWRMTAGDPLIHPSAELGEGVVLSAGVVVGKNARVGRDTEVGPNTVIGAGVTLGRGCFVGSNVSIGFALIGDNVRILSGAVIGEAGFGVAAGRAGAVDIPQLGRAILQDGVTVGANSCIDRGAWDDTVVGENTKIDNLVQVAHNVRLGRSCALAAHTGISGSTVVGDGVQFGGRAGVADHVTIGDGARIAAAAGVMRDLPAGETWGGMPAQPVRQWMRQTAWLARASRPRGGGSE
jgi:UDP-3-O-[3-hydroxymyristoyl] glucosamine N-acyltransferase